MMNEIKHSIEIKMKKKVTIDIHYNRYSFAVKNKFTFQPKQPRTKYKLLIKKFNTSDLSESYILYTLYCVHHKAN